MTPPAPHLIVKSLTPEGSVQPPWFQVSLAMLFAKADPTQGRPSEGRTWHRVGTRAEDPECLRMRAEHRAERGGTCLQPSVRQQGGSGLGPSPSPWASPGPPPMEPLGAGPGTRGGQQAGRPGGAEAATSSSLSRPEDHGCAGKGSEVERRPHYPSFSLEKAHSLAAAGPGAEQAEMWGLQAPRRRHSDPWPRYS